jgi:hypothetical protein
MPSTSRGAFPSPSAGAAADVPADLLALANRIAAVGALYGTGTVAARPAAASSNEGTFYWATDTSLLYYSNGSAWSVVKMGAILGRDITWSSGSAPPGSPSDGDIWRYTGIADQTWLFRYNASGGTYKWEFIGGPSYLSGSTESFTLPNPGALTTGATDGAKFTAPRSGVYRVEYGVHSVYSTINAAVMVWALQVNGTDGVQARRDTLGSSIPMAGASAETEVTLASTQIARVRYNYVLDGSGGFANYVNPFVSVIPVRVS